MLWFKAGVGVRHFGRELAEVLERASEWSLIARVDVEVNSVDDGKHGASTLHGQSLAIDLDPATDRADDTARLARFLAQRLSPVWQVILEVDHVHCEFDTGRRI
jgi:hypothetical protein